MPLAIKFGSVVTYHEGLPPIKSYDPLITYPYKITWQTKTLKSNLAKTIQWAAPTHKVTWPFEQVIFQDHVINWNQISTTIVPTDTIHGRLMTYLEVLLSILSHGSLIKWSNFNQVIIIEKKVIKLNKKHYISTTTIAMVTKLGRVVTYHEDLPHIKLHDSSLSWLYEVTWQIKSIISPLSQCLWLQNLSGWWNIARSSQPSICMTPQWAGLVRSCNKLSELYLHLEKTQAHQTNPGADLPWETPTLKVTWPLDYLINVKSSDNSKNVYLHFHKTYDHETWQDVELREEIQHANV